MIEKLIDWGLGYRWWIVSLVIISVIVGFISLSRLPIDAVPDITNVSVMVNTKTGALAPEANLRYPDVAVGSGGPAPGQGVHGQGRCAEGGGF